MPLEDQIIALEDKLLNALKSGDCHSLDELLHDNLIFNIPTGETISKQIDIENYRSGKMVVSDMEIYDLTISTIDDVCMAAMAVLLKARYENMIIDGRYKYLRVWKFTNNVWQVIAGSGVQIQ